MHKLTSNWEDEDEDETGHRGHSDICQKQETEEWSGYIVIYIVLAKISSLRNPYVTGKMTIVFWLDFQLADS